MWAVFLWISSFHGFHETLESKIKGKTFMVNGGFQFDRDEISSIDEKELKEIAFSLLKEEKNLINIVKAEYFPFSIKRKKSNVLGFWPQFSKHLMWTNLSLFLCSLGLLEREAASILNASLRPLAYKTIGSFKKSLEKI